MSMADGFSVVGTSVVVISVKSKSCLSSSELCFVSSTGKLSSAIKMVPRVESGEAGSLVSLALSMSEDSSSVARSLLVSTSTSGSTATGRLL